MQRSLFRKYFSVCCSIVLMSIVVLGIIFMVFAAQYFREDKLGALEKNAGVCRRAYPKSYCFG